VNPVAYKKNIQFYYQFSDASGIIGAFPSANLRSYPLAIMELINSCKEFKPLEEHSRNFWKNLSLLKKAAYLKDLFHFYFSYQEQLHLKRGIMIAILTDILQKLAGDGFLIEKINFLEIIAHQNPVFSPAKLEKVTIITRDRLENAQECLQSFNDNAKAWGRKQQFVLCDDSPTSEMQERYRATAAAIKNKNNIAISYLGRPQRQLMISALSSKGIPPQVLHFALFGVEGLGQTYGCNRNASLLESAGEAFFSTDDDVFCRPARSPYYLPGLKLGMEGEANIIYTYHQREEALQAANYENIDYLGMHEKYLGQAVAKIVDQHVSEELSLEHLSLPFENTLRQGKCFNAVTFGGLIGDGGSASPSYFFFCAGKTREHLVKNKKNYDLAFSSRHVVKACERVGINSAGTCMTTFFGLDNRQLIPPFFPHFRNEDRLWGELLGHTLYGSCYAYIPWALQHLPKETRNFTGDHTREINLWGHDETISFCYKGVSLLPARPTAENLKKMGLHFKELSKLSPLDFRQRLKEQLWFCLGNKINLNLNFLNSEKKLPSFWKKDLLAQTNYIKDLSKNNIPLTNNEIIALRGIEQSEQLMQQILSQYGDLLIWWPDIIESAKEFKTKGWPFSLEINP
jgi:hypothetical protein